MRSLFDCKGQSIVEVSLITPLLLIALYVPFDFGISIFAGHMTQNAVRDGARIASTTDLMDGTKATAVASAVFTNLPQLLVEPNKDVTVTYYATGSATCAQNVQVTARGTYNFTLYRLITLFGFAAPSPMQITRTTRLRYEKQPDLNGGTGSTLDLCTTETASGSQT